MESNPEASDVIAAAKACLDKGFTPIDVIKSLRADFDIGLVEAKRAYVRASQGISLEEHQGKFLHHLLPALREMESVTCRFS